MSVLIRLELAAPGVQVLQGDHQLFNGAPSNYLSRREVVHILMHEPSQDLLNPVSRLILKTSTLPSSGQKQLSGENSMVEKLSERMLASYFSHGEVYEPLHFTLVKVPDSLNAPVFNVRFHYMGDTFYVEMCCLIQSSGPIARRSPKETGHLKENRGVFKNSGSPNGRKLRGDGGPDLGLKIQTLVTLDRKRRALSPPKGSRRFSTKDSLPAGLEKLGKLSKSNMKNTELVNTKVIDIVADEDVLMAAYAKIKSSPGNMTPGADSETLDGISLKDFTRMKKDLRTGAFQFRPARRLEIPKASGKGSRPLGIAPPRDKIVQEAMRLVLEAVFEPSFSIHSHGFRPKRGCHTALGEIKRTFTSMNWFIEGDISKCFDTFDHKLLIETVNQRISDKPFTDLLHKALRAGYMYQGNFFSPEIGTPQGSIVSPILCNILLDKFDKFMEELISNFDKGSRHRINPL